MSETLSCKDISSSAGEHLYGTAPRVDHWFLLEYPGHWEKDIPENTSLPQSVKDELSKLLGSFTSSRLQLIKGSSLKNPSICFYYIDSSEFDPKAYKFKLNSYEDIIGLDLLNLIKSGDISDVESDEKLALICTHGSYDSCCGKNGTPVYNEISKNENLSVWRSTHVGAHRFSSNVVMLPEGIYYGRIDQKNLGKMIRSHLNNEIYLDCFRGRCCYSQPSQVSDYFLRKETGKYGIYDIKWEFEKDRDAYTAVEFKLQGENLGYSVNSVVMNDAIKIKTSCKDNEPVSIPQFYFYSLFPYIPKEKQDNDNDQ